MAESWIKIKATVNEIYKHFEECPSELFYIKHYDGEKNYKGKDDVPIVFEALIRHNEIGYESIERPQPYTLDSLEKKLAEKVKEYEHDKKIMEENNKNPRYLDFYEYLELKEDKLYSLKRALIPIVTENAIPYMSIEDIVFCVIKYKNKIQIDDERLDAKINSFQLNDNVEKISFDETEEDEEELID